MVHPEYEFTFTCTYDFVTDLNKLHQELKKHKVDAQYWYQLLADFQYNLALKFEISSQASSRLNYYI